MEGGVGVNRGHLSLGAFLNLGREDKKTQDSVLWSTRRHTLRGASEPSHHGAIHFSDGLSVPKIVVHIWSGTRQLGQVQILC